MVVAVREVEVVALNMQGTLRTRSGAANAPEAQIDSRSTHLTVGSELNGDERLAARARRRGARRMALPTAAPRRPRSAEPGITLARCPSLSASRACSPRCR